MNRQEALAVFKVMKNAYPNVYRDFKENDINGFVDLWVMMFSEESVQLIIEAIKAVIENIEYPPTIAHIKKQIKVMTNSNSYDTEEEAWFKVTKALANSYYNSVKEFDKLDDISKRLIGSSSVLRSYGQMDTDKLHTVVKSNFMRSYKSMIQERKEFENLPNSAKQLSQQLGNENKLLGE